MTAFDLHTLDAGDVIELPEARARRLVIPLRGLVADQGGAVLAPGLAHDAMALHADGAAVMAVVEGTWRDPAGDCGIFRVVPAPHWWEATDPEPVIQRAPGTVVLEAQERQELVCMAGRWEVEVAAQCRTVQPGDRLDLAPGTRAVATATTPGYLLRSTGRWGDGPAPAGVVSRRPGDPVGYATNTRFDPHFHDADEYWFVTAGRGEVVSGGARHDVGPGDALFTPAGEVHDVSLVFGQLTGVYVETSLVGACRRGHLIPSVHGTPTKGST